jgi:hypothetical protein
MSWKEERAARQIASTKARATTYQARLSTTTRRDETDGFLITSLYDK